MIADFLLPSTLMGLGIAIDVALVTIVMCGDKSLPLRSWAVPITLTHALFPALGYYLFWALGKNHHYLTGGLGIAGALLVFAYVYEMLCEWREVEPVYSVSEKLESLSRKLKLPLPIHWLAILSVSWDALLCGPAKSAQATHAAWSHWQVFGSLLIVGIIVFSIAQLAMYVGRHVLQQPLPKHIENGLKYAQISVIGGFGVLSLKVAFPGAFTSAGLYSCIALSFVAVGITMLLASKKPQQHIHSQQNI